MTRSALLAAALSLAPFLAPPPATAAEPPLSAVAPEVAAEVRAGRPLVLYVVVPLCSNEQINCGSTVAGRPEDLEHNLYWGAVFGARRFFDRKGSGWERVEVTRKDAVFLERAVYRRMVPGEPWGRSAPVEQLVVMQAIHGASIDRAVDHLWSLATAGGRVSFQDGDRRRDERIGIVGYAGHNRLMDGKTLPPASTSGRAPIPSFILACVSESWFGASLEGAGSLPLVMTRSLMAPEAYLIDAIAKGLGENLPAPELRKRAVAAYGKWQHLTPREAGSVFAKR